MTRVVYVIMNHDTNQAYAGLTKYFKKRVADHRRRKAHLFTGRHAVFKTEPLTDKAAQRFEARAVRFLQSIGFHTVNDKKAGSLGSHAGSIWTKERCIEEAAKFTTRKDFERNAIGAYVMAQRKGWLHEICAHMPLRKKPSGYWTKERCAKEALKYTTRKDFERNAKGVYNTARRNGWFDEICRHMPYKKKPNEPLRRPRA